MSLSVILTAAGVIIAALGDFSFDLFGYSMALTSVFFQVGPLFLNYYWIRFSFKTENCFGAHNYACFTYGIAYIQMQTMYLVLVEKSGAEDGLSSIEIMFYNSFLSLPFLLFVIIATGEFPNSLALLFAKVRI